MKQLFLHVGMHKTGTTALQQFLSLNRQRLLEHGICYPDTGAPSHADLAAALRQGDRQPLLDVLADPANARHPSLLLSSEDFVRSAPKLGFLRERAPATTVILYLRRQDHYVESMYQETVKRPEARSTQTFQEYYERFWKDGGRRVAHRLDWHALVQGWGDLVGRENLIVRPYERDRFAGGSIFAEFLSLLGIAIDDTFALPKRQKSNVGLPPEVVEVLRMSNAYRGKREQAKLVVQLYEIVSANPEAKAGRGYDYLSPAQRVALLERLDEGNRRIASEYLGREDGRLFLEPWPDPAQPWDKPRLDLEKGLAMMARVISRQQPWAGLLALFPEQASARTRLLERLLGSALRKWQLWRDIRLVRKSGLFDREHYLGQFPEARQAGIDPLAHYVKQGWLEGRNPSPSFDTFRFLADNPDVLASGRCPLVVHAKRTVSRGG